MKPRTCMYCGRNNVVKVTKDDIRSYVDHYELDYKCEDCLAEWWEHYYPGEHKRQGLVKAGIP